MHPRPYGRLVRDVALDKAGRATGGRDLIDGLFERGSCAARDLACLSDGRGRHS